MKTQFEAENDIEQLFNDFQFKFNSNTKTWDFKNIKVKVKSVYNGSIDTIEVFGKGFTQNPLNLAVFIQEFNDKFKLKKVKDFSQLKQSA